MKTEFVDVNETRKNRARRNPQRRGRHRDRSRRARLLAQGARAGLPSRQGAAARHQAALQGPDPARRRARPDPARGRRCAARAGRRGGRHARRPRRDDRGRPAADLHGVVRHGAGVRSRRSVDDRVPARVERDQRRSGASGAAAAARSRARGSSRSKDAASITATRSCSISSGATRDRRRPTSTPTSASSSARRPTRRGSTSSCSASSSARPRRSRIHYPADYPIGELAEHRRLVYSHGEGAEAPRAAGAGRRVRQGPRRVRHARRAARRACARTSSTRRKHAAEREDRAELMKQLADAAAVRRAGRRWSSAKSIGGSRSSRGG